MSLTRRGWTLNSAALAGLAWRKFMDRISDERILQLIDWLSQPVVQPERWGKDVKAVLVELRERRAADNYVPHPDCPCTKI
jgi:hypothetical protein